MSRSALRYLVYGYIGRRTRNTEGLGVDKPAPGFRFCLYDSEQVHSESDCPVIPAIKDPVFSIEENTAGSMDFTLLADGESEIWYNSTAGGTPVVRTTTLQDSSHNPLPASPEKLFNYILPKQTEIVLYRRMLVGQSYVTKELWAGRVDTIKKDFYNNWSIYVEGELTYLNDVALKEAKLASSATQEQIFRKILELFNNRINSIPQNAKTITFTVPNPSNAAATTSTYTASQILRSFVTGTFDTPALPGAMASTKIDKSFTISDGSTAWSAMQTYLDKYGGHLEVRKDKTITDSIIIDWHNSGTYNEAEGRYNWNGYHPFNNSTSQIIEFGINLLDFSEEQDTSDLYTVLIPHGQAVVTTTTNEDGTTTSTTGPALTVSSVNRMHPGSECIYDDRNVQKYGWIEKVETWNLSDANTLYSVALAYYRELHIGSRSITIKAYDLKNLINAPSDQYSILKPEDPNWGNTLTALESLYLYDVVFVRSTAHLNHGRELIGESQMMPIKGIKIPLDKFPTDTEYTISNGMKKRSMLAPGSVSQVQPNPVPQPTDPTGEDPTPVTPEDPVPIIPPIGSLLGLDGDFIHYPPLYLDRKFSYITAPIGVANSSDTTMAISCGPDIEAYNSRDDEMVLYNLIQWYNRPNTNRFVPQEWTRGFTPVQGGPTYRLTLKKTTPCDITIEYLSSHFGYDRDAVNLAAGEEYAGLTKAPGSVFYTDKLGDGTASMRFRSSTETQSNWFEHVFDDMTDTHSVAELTPFISSNADYYKNISEANVNTSQTWMAHGGQDLGAPEISWTDKEYPAGTSSNQILTDIRTAEVLDSTVGQILSDIGIGISADDLEQGYLTLNMFYTAQGTGNQYTIKQKSIKYATDEALSAHKYYYGIGVAPIGDSVMLYYTTYYMDPAVSIYTAEENMAHSLFLDGLFIHLGVRQHPSNLDIRDMFEGGKGGYGGITHWFKYHDTSTNLDYYTEATEAEYDEWRQDPSQFPGVIDGGLTEIWSSAKGVLSDEYVTMHDMVKSNGLLNRISEPGYANRYIDQLANTWVDYLCWDNYWNGPIEAEKKMGTLNKVKAHASAKPFLILTKAKSVASGESGYGAFLFALPSDAVNDMAITKAENEDYYTFTAGVGPISSNSEGTPVMICSDTLNATRFLFEESNNTLKLTNKHPVPRYSANSTECSPITHMARCGGLHTAYVANDAFIRMGGDLYSSKAVAMDCITPTELTAPGWRSERHTEDMGTYARKWYYGSDMAKLSEVKEGSRTKFNEDMTNDSETELAKHFIDTSTRQPLIMGGQNYVRVTPNLYLRVTSSGEGGES